MEDLNRLCMGCMREKPGTGVCPYCHFSIENYDPPMYHLKPQTIVAGKYLVGKSIGEGGFGITYIGLLSWRLFPFSILSNLPILKSIPTGHTASYVLRTKIALLFHKVYSQSTPYPMPYRQKQLTLFHKV